MLAVRLPAAFPSLTSPLSSPPSPNRHCVSSAATPTLAPFFSRAAPRGQATTIREDDARLVVPGRVWFAKPRRLKNGATLSRVMQGNLKEDMLWQLHDIMLTKSMLSHHRLDKYVKTLDRV